MPLFILMMLCNVLSLAACALQILFFGICICSYRTVRHKNIYVDPLSLKLFNVENEEESEKAYVSAEPAHILKNRCQNAIFLLASFTSVATIYYIM